MRLLRFDSVGGASGDMVLGSLIGLGVKPESVQEVLAGLRLGPFSLALEPLTQRGWPGIRLRVAPPPDDSAHRSWPDIRRLIEEAALPEVVRDLSLRVFERLASAEADVHGKRPEDVHFHEVGAGDTLADIVGSCWALHALDVSAVRVGPLPIGEGTTSFSHGTVPIPVPAVAELLRGFPVVQTREPYELVTPTGAALLTTWAMLHPAPALETERFIVRSSAVAFGMRELQNRPNLLRATLMDGDATDGDRHDECLVLECNVDDMTPELAGSLLEVLLARGALDAFMTPVQMKKQRPGILLTVLCRPADRDRCLETIFAESTTFGVREYGTRRTVLERRQETLDTAYGPIRIKVGIWRGREVTRSPEHGDCVRAAVAHGVPVRRVFEAALAAAWKRP